MAHSLAHMSGPQHCSRRLVGVALRLDFLGRAIAERYLTWSRRHMDCGEEVQSHRSIFGYPLGMSHFMSSMSSVAFLHHSTQLNSNYLINLFSQCSAAAYLSYFFTDCLMSRWYEARNQQDAFALTNRAGFFIIPLPRLLSASRPPISLLRTLLLGYCICPVLLRIQECFFQHGCRFLW